MDAREGGNGVADWEQEPAAPGSGTYDEGGWRPDESGHRVTAHHAGGGDGGHDMTHLASLVGYDTPAGRMLARLYGKPALTAVPKPRTAPWKPKGSWERPMHGDDAVDPRLDRINRAAISTLEVPPAVPVREVHVPAIDTIKGHRKTASAIAADAAARAATDDVPLPPAKPGYNNPEAEKRRLQATFAFKGGKALPQAGLPKPLDSHLPLHVLSGTTTRRAGRGGSDEDGGGGGSDGGRSAHAIAAAHGLDAHAAAVLAVATQAELAYLSECRATLMALSDGIVDAKSYAGGLAAVGGLTPEVAATVTSDIAEKRSAMARLRADVTAMQHRIAARVPVHTTDHGDDAMAPAPAAGAGVGNADSWDGGPVGGPTVAASTAMALHSRVPHVAVVSSDGGEEGGGGATTSRTLRPPPFRDSTGAVAAALRRTHSARLAAAGTATLAAGGGHGQRATAAGSRRRGGDGGGLGATGSGGTHRR